jgi:hypothetical protein
VPVAALLQPFSAASRVTAARLNLASSTFGVYKNDTTEVQNNATSAITDPDLQVPASLLTANAVYSVNLFVTYSGGASGSSDLSIGFGTPAGSTLSLNWGFGTAAASPVQTLSYGANVVAGSATTVLWAEGSLILGSTVTALIVQWCQGTSNATYTKILPGSALLLTRIA